MAESEPPGDQNTHLALALLDDDEDALEEMARAYGPSISKILTAKYVQRLGVLRVEDIEDVVSIALHRVWEARRDYDDTKTPLRAWFYRIAENVAKDTLRLGSHKASLLQRNPGEDWLDSRPQTPAAEPTPSERKKETKMITDLMTVVEKLPEVQRKIVLADAASRDEVASGELLADELDIPAANVRVYRKRAMDKIRSEMTKLGHDLP